MFKLFKSAAKKVDADTAIFLGSAVAFGTALIENAHHHVKKNVQASMPASPENVETWHTIKKPGRR